MAVFKKPMWTLDEALVTVRELRPVVAALGWHIAIGGGVLNEGKSFHDLDLYLLPLDSNKIRVDSVSVLAAMQNTLGATRTSVLSAPEKVTHRAYQDDAQLVSDGKRIDVFVIREK